LAINIGVFPDGLGAGPAADRGAISQAGWKPTAVASVIKLRLSSVRKLARGIEQRNRRRTVREPAAVKVRIESGYWRPTYIKVGFSRPASKGAGKLLGEMPSARRRSGTSCSSMPVDVMGETLFPRFGTGIREAVSEGGDLEQIALLLVTRRFWRRSANLDTKQNLAARHPNGRNGL